jgi:SAM-dependent methyltransferase
MEGSHARRPRNKRVKKELSGLKMIWRLRKLFDAVAKRIGPASAKRRIWDHEHASGHWDWTKDPSRSIGKVDIAYEALDRRSAGLDILDLGCGDGYTCGAIAGHFREYLGVDISKLATEHARERISQDPEKGPKSQFEAGDIVTFVPPKKFSVILFSECLYYFPGYQVKHILQRYSQFLEPEGLLIVRLCDRNKYRSIVTHIENNFCVLETLIRENNAGVVLTFVPQGIESRLSSRGAGTA